MMKRSLSLVWLPKPATNLLPIRRRSLRELWSSAATQRKLSVRGANPELAHLGQGLAALRTVHGLIGNQLLLDFYQDDRALGSANLSESILPFRRAGGLAVSVTRK